MEFHAFQGKRRYSKCKQLCKNQNHPLMCTQLTTQALTNSMKQASEDIPQNFFTYISNFHPINSVLYDLSNQNDHSATDTMLKSLAVSSWINFSSICANPLGKWRISPLPAFNDPNSSKPPPLLTQVRYLSISFHIMVAMTSKSKTAHTNKIMPARWRENQIHISGWCSMR